MNNSQIHSVDDLIIAIEAAASNNDLEALDSYHDYFQESKEPAPLPLSVPVEFNPKKVPEVLAHTEGDVAIAVFNRLSRAKRGVSYRLKIAGGYQGPIIVEEGDSWFQYPVKLDDVIDNLMEPFAVCSLSGAGHLFHDMLAANEYTGAIHREGADFFLISGGGNDMLHSERLTQFLHRYQNGMEAREVIVDDAFERFLDDMLNGYRRMCGGLVRRFPDLRILCHGYDRALPRKDGTWLGKPLEKRQVPEELWNDIIAILIDELNIGLKSLETSFPGRVFHVDCRGSVGDQKNQWHDELHPKNPGYARAATRFEEMIRALSRGSSPSSSRESLAQPMKIQRKEAAMLFKQSVSNPETARRISHGMDIPTSAESMPMTEAVIPDDVLPPAMAPIDTADVIPEMPRAIPENVTPLPDSELARWRSQLDAVDREAYRHWTELMETLDDPETEERQEARRELMQGNDAFSLERIIGESEIFQVNYLSRGSRAAASVGRITVMNQYGMPQGFGSGFLVAPGLLLTNHHVLSRQELVTNSYILFDYEYDADNSLKQTVRFDFSDDIYLSNKELDFAFVAVKSRSQDGQHDLDDFGHLMLIRQSGKAIKREPVSILQHASGLPKQVAMRNSIVLGRKEHYLYYTSDTNSGSSGSPVLTDEWFPVALHHRAVPDMNKARSYVANRGIRISSIFNKLDYLAEERRDEMAVQVLACIEPRSERSPGSAIPTGTFDNTGRNRNERLVEPYHDIPYDDRAGYDEDFLEIRVPRPRFRRWEIVAKRLDNDSPIIEYEHFSVVMHKHRRLPLFAASNVDASPEKKEPEEGYRYTRKALAGLGRNDREKWFTDPRIADHEQLPDRFFTRDRGAFDRGHNVRRDDVAWGDTYEEVRRANGDTYHTTNCTPQVSGFNQSSLGGIWGELENIILRQAENERYCVFSGPVLDPSDQSFEGRDNSGNTIVQIPAKYWKVVVAVNGSGELESYAFLLEQDLSNVPLEFAVDAEWQRRMISIPALEVILRDVVFPQEIHHADQINSDAGELIRTTHSVELFGGFDNDGY